MCPCVRATDFLYACGKYTDHHDAGEAAHWPPFQAAAVAVLRDRANFSNPASWSDDTKKLVAFVFGVSVHYTCDELWEGLTGELSDSGMIELVDALNLGQVNEMLVPCGAHVGVWCSILYDR